MCGGLRGVLAAVGCEETTGAGELVCGGGMPADLT